MMRREAIKKERSRQDRVSNFFFAIAAGLAAVAATGITLGFLFPDADELMAVLPVVFLGVAGVCIYKWVIK